MPDILGINLSKGSEEDALKKVSEFLNGGSLRYIVTPNPEIILAAQKDPAFFKILNQADLSLADGFGLKLAGYLTKQKITRITGADFSLEVLALAQMRHLKVMVINWESGLSTAREIKAALAKNYPQLNCLVADVARSENLDEEAQAVLKDFAPQIIFSALGFPYQEKIIFNNLKNWPSARLAIGVGGTFDFLTGKAKRAPKIMRRLGLEWLWRLMKQPRRIARIYRATLVFTAKILANK